MLRRTITVADVSGHPIGSARKPTNKVSSRRLVSFQRSQGRNTRDDRNYSEVREILALLFTNARIIVGVPERRKIKNEKGRL